MMAFTARKSASVLGGNEKGKGCTTLALEILWKVVITSLAIAVRDVMLYPWLKRFLVAVLLCFWLSSLIRKLPYTDRVL